MQVILTETPLLSGPWNTAIKSALIRLLKPGRIARHAGPQALVRSQYRPDTPGTPGLKPQIPQIDTDLPGLQQRSTFHRGSVFLSLFLW